IDYRFMSIPEQNFIMTELARLKREGRIEVLRERAANFHVFAFLDGVRPSDELITASLDEVGGPLPEDAEASADKSPKTKPSAKSRTGKTKSKPTKKTHGKSTLRQKRGKRQAGKRGTVLAQL